MTAIYDLAVDPVPDDYPDPDQWASYGPRKLRAIVEDREVGWVAFYPVDPEGADCLWIIKLYVEPDCRRGGIATGLMDELRRQFPEHDLHVDGFLPDGEAFWARWAGADQGNVSTIDDYATSELT